MISLQFFNARKFSIYLSFFSFYYSQQLGRCLVQQPVTHCTNILLRILTQPKHLLLSHLCNKVPTIKQPEHTRQAHDGHHTVPLLIPNPQPSVGIKVAILVILINMSAMKLFLLSIIRSYNFVHLFIFLLQLLFPLHSFLPSFSSPHLPYPQPYFF